MRSGDAELAHADSYESATPGFSIIVPVYHPDPEHLRLCIRSVFDQTYGGWELLLVADGPQPRSVDRILQEVAQHDQVTVLRLDANRGISAASQAALEVAAKEYIALLDHDDQYSIHALGAFAAELMSARDRAGRPVDLAYSDEDKLELGTGRRTMPFYKPGFSMERLRAQMYLGHLLVFRRELALAVGGFRSEYDGAQDHDLALRIVEQAHLIVHVPRILYHWRESSGSTAYDVDSKGWAWSAGSRAVADHLRRTNFPAEAVASSDAHGVVDLRPRLDNHPMVSVIIPTGGARRVVRGVDVLLAENAIRSLVERSTYPDFEIVVVLDSNADDGLPQRLSAAAQAVPLKVLRDNRSFSFADACNVGAVRASGEVLVFLNDDTEIEQPDWMDRVVMYAITQGIGAVGVKLLYGDGRVQHAGVWSRGTGPAHRYVGFGRNHPGNFHALRLPQNCLAVTAACLGIERSRFNEVGGFSTQFPLAYNDVDLCLKLTKKGYRNVVDCATEVIHHESSSRDPRVKQWEVDALSRRWRPLLVGDPFDNPCNLAVGVDEFPPTPIDIVEMKTRSGDLVLSGRSWPDSDFYNIGGRWNE